MNIGNEQVGLVNEYSDYVIKIAKQVKRNLHSSVDTQDLIGYGMTGLLEAAKRFNPDLGVSFSTFSYYRIRGAIYDGLRKMGSLNRTEYKRLLLEKRTNDFLQTDKTKIRYDDKAISYTDELSCISKKIKCVASIYLTSLSAVDYFDVKDDSIEETDEKLSRLQLYEKIQKAIFSLPKIDQEIIKFYYFEELSLEEVGQKMGLSKSWTSRKHAKAIEKLSDIFFHLIKENPPRNRMKN